MSGGREYQTIVEARRSPAVLGLERVAFQQYVAGGTHVLQFLFRHALHLVFASEQSTRSIVLLRSRRVKS
jgi:hypothetical protein